MAIGPHLKSQRTTVSDTAWRNRASCRFTSPGLFFPVGSTGKSVVGINEAKAVCHACPVRSDCLQYAFETDQDNGIWGGTTEDERRRSRRAWLASRRG